MHASRTSEGEIMRAFIAESAAPRAAAIAAFALAAFAAGAAVAQQDRWIDPTQTWSFDFVSNDWGHAEGLPPDFPALLLTMPLTRSSDNESRMCFVEGHVAALVPGEDAAMVRARAGEMSVAQAENAFSRYQLRETRMTYNSVEGVTVAVVDAVSRGARFRGRAFVTVARDRQVLSTVACLSTPNVPQARDAEIDTILNTIRFHTTDDGK